MLPCLRRQLGDASQRTSVGHLMHICDEALGKPIMSDLYWRYASLSDFDIRWLWQALGIQRGKDGAVFATEGAAMRNLFFNSAQFPEPLS